MNSLSTHDTERALTIVAGEPLNGRDRNWQANQRLSPEQRKLGVKLLKIASAMQYTLPGFPCVYYGDEAGMEGYRDPFNRCCYPWGKEDKELLDWHRKLGGLRARCSALWDGEFVNAFARDRRLAYIRHDGKAAIYCAFNLMDHDDVLTPPPGFSEATPFFGSKFEDNQLHLKSMSCEFLLMDL